MNLLFDDEYIRQVSDEEIRQEAFQEGYQEGLTEILTCLVRGGILPIADAARAAKMSETDFLSAMQTSG